MAEFKVNKALKNEISSARDANNLINDSYTNVSSDDVSTLNTATKFISQHNEIKVLLDLYKSLVDRDLNDLDKMVEEVNEMDTMISSTYNA